jgi:hypothetical protein
MVIKMDESNTKIQAYYLLPTTHLIPEKNHRLRMATRVFAKAYRHDSLGAFYRMWTREAALNASLQWEKATDRACQAR